MWNYVTMDCKKSFQHCFLFVDECHDDTLQCKLWATNGHCRGVAYAEFMKRHCKATCGYCGRTSKKKCWAPCILQYFSFFCFISGLPSIIKETLKLTKNTSLSQDGEYDCWVSLKDGDVCVRWHLKMKEFTSHFILHRNMWRRTRLRIQLCEMARTGLLWKTRKRNEIILRENLWVLW